MHTRTTRSPLLSLTFNRSAGEPLQQQIFNQVREAILSGRLKPGTRIPSTRVLANELKLSRNTILGAFERLYAEGYIEGKMGSGTKVSNVLPEDLLSARTISGKQASNTALAGKLSKLSRDISDMNNQGRHFSSELRAFRPSLPDLRQFPFKLWSQLIAKSWRNPPTSLLISGDMGGYLPLRETIVSYLNAVRGLNCTAEQVIITSGAQQAIDLIARTIIDPGDDVWVEDPGYEGLRAALMAAGARLNHISVDDYGLSVREGIQKAPNAVLAAVTPSHQYPLGVTMSLARRLELLDWAVKTNAWILEDDYDSEFRYSGKPLSALQGLDETGRVIYVGSFSKVLFPSLRLGYVVVPKPILGPFTVVSSSIDDYTALALQPDLHNFIKEGYFSSHIRKLRKLYAIRQEMLIDALDRQGDGLFTASSHEAGMHLVVNINPEHGISDKQAARLARNTGLIAPALSGYYNGSLKSEGLILGYAGLNEQEINRDVKRLVKALKTATLSH